ncbi:T9SS type A sorting domain-containing protein [Flavobacterium sp. Sd200]|uniref:T9SS type A sorting domain-containing protein n=1 Tax=Flavobacterium sp. Sd200 TaxID=2692211 RepID=UPI00137157BC|nr:T9SS type A sorting domain-containing protein [Flavobacterium sp. Sd200]MXN91447.1 T9SS type A sorting domain-containing protein [Flavobacterium sp. Sd200]
MKKIILLALFAVSFATKAQTISLLGNGEEITEGQVFTFTALTDRDRVNLSVTNLSDETINLKLKANSVSYPTDYNIQFCFGEECFFNISTGSTVPSDADGLTLAPGESNPDGDHFLSNNPGNGTEPVTYSLSVIQVDENGTELAILRTFSYVYSPTANINDFSALQNMGITVKNTVVKNQLELNSTLNATLQIINLNGQAVKNVAVKTGSQSVDLSSLSSAVYFARFTTDKNKTAQIKIVKN